MVSNDFRKIRHIRDALSRTLFFFVYFYWRNSLLLKTTIIDIVAVVLVLLGTIFKQAHIIVLFSQLQNAKLSSVGNIAIVIICISTIKRLVLCFNTLNERILLCKREYWLWTSPRPFTSFKWSFHSMLNNVQWFSVSTTLTAAEHRFIHDVNIYPQKMMN